MLEMTTSELIDGLQPLVDANRLTTSGELFVDGVQIASATGPDLEEPEYNKFGLSDRDEYGCVRIETVDKAIKNYRENGNDFQKFFCKSLVIWFGIRQPGKEYETSVLYQLLKNYRKWVFTSGWLNIYMFNQFRVYGKYYIHKETGETRDSLGVLERKSHDWIYNKAQMGEHVADRYTVVWGNYGNVRDLASWEGVFMAGMGGHAKAWFAGSLMGRAEQAAYALPGGPFYVEPTTRPPVVGIPI